MLANMITVSRMLFSLLLLTFPPRSYLFSVFYLLCGVTDVLDGFIARKLHTESEKGAMLDSAADLLFAATYTVKILPHLSVPLWIWTWVAIIGITKITGILLKCEKKHTFSIEHSFANKLTGLLIFLVPLTVCIIDVRYSVIPVCTVATVTAVEELCKLKGRTESE